MMNEMDGVNKNGNVNQESKTQPESNSSWRREDNEVQQQQQRPLYRHPTGRTSSFITDRSYHKLKTDRGRIMVFIDGSNLFYTAQMMGIGIDYIKLIDALIEPKSVDEKLIRVNFYAGIDVESEASIKWEHFMRRTGFKMVTKHLVTYPDGTRKANCDVEMAVDMVTLTDKYDTAILITGDGDLTSAVKYCVSRGVQVHLVGHKQTTNDSLLSEADRFIDLELLRPHIALNRPTSSVFD